MVRSALGGVLLLAAAGALLQAAEPASADRRAAAVKAGLDVVQKAMRNYPEHRQCFSCHHQTMPLLAMTEARRAGYEIDAPLLEDAKQFSHKFFTGRAKSLRAGKNIGGSALTVGYGLWALALAEQATDDTTEAMVSYLLQTQKDDGFWRRPSFRPPMSESDIACTTIAAYYLPMLAVEPQQGEIEKSVAKARTWLEAAEAKSQEDKNLRLWGLSLLGAEKDLVESARQAVLSARRDDGGWGQLDDMPSDAYATAQALYVLRSTGTAADSDAYRRGVEFLLQTQLEDGSWLVETRAKPVQAFFDNGDPHGKSQFISIAATAWAVAALCQQPSQRDEVP
ncbi:MAG: terpene cyclase/mutase family protein [Pirellulaceae bacterium]